MSMAHTDESWHDEQLNVATAAMFHGKEAGSAALPISPEMVLVSLVAPLLAIAAWQLMSTEQTLVSWQTLSSRVRDASAALRRMAGHFLVYALSGITTPITGFQMARAKASAKGRRESISSRSSNRRTFTLDSRLDTCQLEPKPARRRSVSDANAGGPNVLPQATLEPPVIDLPWISGSTPASLGSLEERINTLSDLVADINARKSRSPKEPPPAAAPSRRRTGAKPKIQNMRDSGLMRDSPSPTPSPALSPQAKRALALGHSAASLKSLSCSDSSPSISSTSGDDSDWEDEPRAEVPESGDPMDGEDVGCPPRRIHYLPRAQVQYTVLPVWGRSIFVSDWEIPRQHVEDFKSTVEDFLLAPAAPAPRDAPPAEHSLSPPKLAKTPPQPASAPLRNDQVLLLDRKGVPTKTVKKTRVRPKKNQMKDRGVVGDENQAAGDPKMASVPKDKVKGKPADKGPTLACGPTKQQGFGRRNRQQTKS